jgi:RNA polymerase sigma factor (sigma-70 family)
VPEENITQLVRRFRHGDASAREGLAAAVYERLVRLSRKMLREGSEAVQRWEQTEDLAHAAWFRIQRALEDPTVEVKDHVHFFRLAARHIRFELIDLYRRHTGANGLAANHHSTPVGRAGGDEAAQDDAERFAANLTGDPRRLAAWGEFHVLVESLPEKDKEIMDLIWYQGLKQQDAADLLGVDVKTIKRRWRDVKILLSEQLEPDLIEF